MIPADWEAEQKQLQRLAELKKTELASFDSVKPPERVVGETTTKSKDGILKTTTIAVGPVSPERKAPPESIALGAALISSISGRLGADPILSWYFNFGRNVNMALNHADSRDVALRMSGVENFREFVKMAPPEIDKALIEEADNIAAIIANGIFKPEESLKLTASFSKIDSVIGMYPPLPHTIKIKP